MTQPSASPPPWRRPPGVAAGTWQYLHQRTIARHYDDFVAGTPLCELDSQYVLQQLGPLAETADASNSDGFHHRRVSVLDLGCGTGRLAWPLAELGFDVLAVDLSHSMLTELLAKNHHPLPQETVDDPPRTAAASVVTGRVLPIHANLVQLDGLRDAVADHAICMFSTLGMIQGRDNRIHALRHAARVVRPGGRLLLHVHRRWASLRERHGVARLAGSAWRSLIRKGSEFGDWTYAYRGLDNMFMHRFTARELKRDLGTAGWTVETIDTIDLRGESTGVPWWNASGFFLRCRRERPQDSSTA
ncbi:class I SAM-dependent methyltransferase [Roseiconus nitratireducens]|uniref:Class I SAM-dependent methyltransferase n=1 Tax=Roseiconus nitratireducens TaxID=2605748 RepID=A0A5M6DLY2_9BACT|nr:class I SAM-dependent methyltransferase [Roseiconus nitratireducens]KAA5547229.1 class I SAM-dependent methyltransferase [Roseiconus nitratireducens]